VQIVYLDTSAAMKLVIEEAESDALVDELAGEGERQLVSSWLLHTEMHCAAGRHPQDVDLDAVRGPGSDNTHARTAKGVRSRPSTGKTADDERRGGSFSTLDTIHDTAGAPPLDTWIIPTQPYAGSHYATFPEALVIRPIKAMCPLRVCAVCGKPSERITERSDDYAAAREAIGDFNQRPKDSGAVSGSRSVLAKAAGRDITCAENITVGWTECDCPDTPTKWRTGVVLDPFAGSGTTLRVATGHGRDAIGIDLDERNADLATDRIGPLMCTVEDRRQPRKEAS